jgi:hypothetical protein
MNNTKTTLTIVAIFMAATLVVGTFATTTNTIATTGQSAYAYSQKKDNGKGNGNGNTVTVEECKNKGSASGFDTTLDQECENLICTHPGENATCVSEGAAVTSPTTTTTTTAPVKLTCEQCFTKFLSSEQISGLLRALEVFGVNSLADLCEQLSSGSNPELAGLLQDLLIRLGADQLIQCLIDAGVQFPPPRPTP